MHFHFVDKLPDGRLRQLIIINSSGFELPE
jgi:hypothetical protein